MFKLINKNESLEKLSKYFKKFDINELCYYLDNYNGESISTFLESNIYESDEIELINFLKRYLKIITNKIFYLTTPLNLKRTPIKLSFVTNSIYWDDIFVIEETIFISYQYIIKIFDKIETNDYKSIDDIYFCEDIYFDENENENNNEQIFDMGLLKKLCENLYYVLQFLNLDSWLNHMNDKCKYCFVDKSNINFKNNYIILKEPNASFICDKIIVYFLDSGEIFAVINSIYSELSFSPYWEKKIIMLKYENGIYTEIIDKTNLNKIHNNNKNKIDYMSFQSNPFISKAKQMTDCIIHNK